MKRMFCMMLAGAVTAACTGGVPLEWEVTPEHPAPVMFDRYRGETLELRATFRGFGGLPFAQGADVRLWYQTNGMERAWWSIPATVASNSVSATWTPADDPGGERLSMFFGAPSNAYAAAVLRLRASPGAEPNVLPPPERASFTETDPVFSEWLASFVFPETSLEPSTNYTNEAIGEFARTGTVFAAEESTVSDLLRDNEAQRWSVSDILETVNADIYDATDDLRKEVPGIASNTVTKGYVEGLGISTGTTTNDVRNIVTNTVTVGVGNQWTFSGVDLNPPHDHLSLTWERYGQEGYWLLEGVVELMQVSVSNPDAPEDAASITFYDVMVGVDDNVRVVDITATRPSVTYNTLGLARMVDLPPLTNGLVTARTVTNIVEGLSSGAPEWQEVQLPIDTIAYVTNGMARGTFAQTDVVSANTNGWPEGGAVFARVVTTGGYSVAPGVRLVGYGWWPTNDFQAVWWRCGTNVYVNVIVEE